MPFLIFIAVVMLLVFLQFNRKQRIHWKMFRSERISGGIQVSYDLYDGERFLERVFCTKEDSNECSIEGTRHDDCLSLHFDKLPKDSHVEWSEIMLELYIKKFY